MLNFLLFCLIAFIILFLYLNIWKNMLSFVQYLLWKRKETEVYDYTEDDVRQELRSISKKSFEFSSDNIPYGRAKWFIESNMDFFSEFSNTEFEFFGYAPVRSSNADDFNEYGLLLTQYGIFEKVQNKETGNTNVQYLPFSMLWKVSIDSNKNILFHYPYGNIRQLKSSNKVMNSFEELKKLISSGYTRDLNVDEFYTPLIKIEKRNLDRSEKSSAILSGVVSSILLRIGDHLHSTQINSIVSAPAGHGHAAEYANNLVDKIKYPFQEVKQVGQNNAKNGADRIVGGQQIQTKYYSNARGTVNAAFESKADGGMYRYNGIQLEVPKDQYDEALRLMQDKIRQNKVEGVTNPQEAKNIVRKGNVTYQEAKLVAKGGNFVSLKYDALDGAIQSLPGASISFVMIFIQAKWSGETTKDAAILATKAGIRTLIIGTSIYVATQQFSKVFTSQINNMVGKKVTAEVVARRAAPVISFAIIVGPDFFEALRGRISKEQLLKNVVVAGGGLAGGMLVGAGVGLVGGPVGALVGSLVGGAAATIGTKKIMDSFIEDDRIEMFAQLKEEFIDIVMVIPLSQQEFEEIQKTVYNKGLDNVLKEMFQQKKESRKFAREYVEERVEKSIQSRKEIKEKDILEAFEISENFFASVA